MIKRILLFVLGLVVLLAILSIFGNPFKFVWWCIQWIAWGINVVAMWMTRNPEINYLLSTTPGNLSLIMALI